MPNQNRGSMPAFLSKNMLLLSVLLLSIFLVAFIATKKNENAKTNKPLVDTKNIFSTTGISVKDFMNVYNSPEFKSINFQFQNNSRDNNGNFRYDLSSYAWSKTPYEGGKAFKTDFINPVPGRQEFNIALPYRYGNLELWKDTIQTFFDKLEVSGGINQYDSILFIPFKDKDTRYVSIEIRPIHAGEAVMLHDTKRACKVLNPCPPNCPHRK